MTALAATATSTGEAVQFWVLGTVAVLGGLGTVLLRRAVHSALCLAGTMIILALFYLANGAYFLGVVQIVVYTGAVMMLFLFVLMLVGVSTADSLKETLKGQRWLAACCALGLGILLIAGIGQVSVGNFNGLGAANAPGNVPALASLLFTKYVVAFEVIGALLTVAAVGATLLTHRERVEKNKSQREQAEERVRSGKQLTPLPAPGVYARHNANDRPALLPDGTPSELSVSRTLRNRGQIREVSVEQMAQLAAIEQRTTEYHGRPGHAGPKDPGERAVERVRQAQDEPADRPVEQSADRRTAREEAAK
ncbi:NADH-quinone oxidoreductase subunit J [Streptomyces albus]|uniref:NADH-quinone oxidoreductase subunit J n=1 Tax=Streptomyces albus TaxID=1888 RepID=A0A8H1L599_9ACTN|nr:MULTISPECIES: NADH-quinone oxidoreductase subunit J [Streptomyces]KPC91866.1 NADH:ubiquinone oxidoreductase subunit J [Streptomyces sp. NRRL F-6602]MDI6412419.1 NADH-quinone oxidoreductase subunit J [Streptomyces albus]TGG75919.1 NADH-quinone oxidoreductase subunit J [Streptomyces albus]UVN55384.1 NADH-quinone oxidoreductase subunit J [Streptomyces albus]GHJ23647.1 NADH:ubiquinone oxidoreductase subunit J [Streptomyces albus]